MSMRKIGNRFFMSFLNGIVILLPAIITISLVRFLVVKVNSILLSPTIKLVAPFVAGEQQHILIAKTIIFILIILMMASIGWMARILFIHRFFSLWEKTMLNFPVLGKVYSTVRQILTAFFGEGKAIFKQVVLVEYPRKGLYSMGFTTGVAGGEIIGIVGKGGLNVFFPTTPNPTTGVFVFVPASEIRVLKMSVEDGMKLVISGGSVTPWISE